MFARIYQPAKNAMQSGRRNAHRWVLDFDAERAREIDPLMGWTSSSDMKGQLRLEFESKEAAIDYATSKGIPFQVLEPKLRKLKYKAYADNFKAGRVQSWTH